jgi:hypothetical protein
MKSPEQERHLLSKSTFMMGLQCPKRLWLYRKRPELRPEVSEAQQLVYERGTNVGLLAQQLFPGGLDASPDEPYQYPASVKQTFNWIRKGETVIYEAAFQHNRVMAALDILVKKNGKWYAYEVKSTKEVKPQHIQDAALQYYVITQAGLPLADISIVHINPEYVRQGKLNIKELFTPVSIKKEVLKLQTQIGEQIEKGKEILQLKKEPVQDIGPHCFDPYTCEFQGHCWSHIPEPSVFDLTRLNGNKKFELYYEGVVSLEQLPKGYRLSTTQQLQVKAYLENYTHIEPEPIKKWLKQLQYPLYFMDFETFMPAVPLYDDTYSYQQLPFQFSVHRQAKPGGPAEHIDYLGHPATDPRPEFIKQLLEATKGKGTVLVYSSFEAARLRELKQDFPRHKKSIDALLDRIVDLLTPFQKKWYYHPSMNGSASIKDVLPALVPELNYDELLVGDGHSAMAAFESLLTTKDTAQTEQIRTALLAYCKLDTWAMVKLLEKLVDS